MQRAHAAFSSNASLLHRRRVSYAQERHLFHVLVTKGITFLCMADEVTGFSPHQMLRCPT